MIINAKGTSNSTFKVGKTGPTLTNTGEIVAPENSNLTISTDAGKGLEISAAGDVARIVTNNQTLNIAATNLQLNGTPWPSTAPQTGQYLTATADGTVWASMPNATVSKSGLMSASDKIRLDNATSNEAGTLPLNPLLIYYGFPIAFKGIWGTNGVIADISANYKYWVVGHTYQEPTHAEYASTTAIIQGVRAAGVKVYGYIPLGTSNYNYTIQEIGDITDQWAAIGVDGIFLDEFGFDYGSTRQRQVDAVSAIHAKGLPICANAWVFEEFACDTLAETGWPVGDWKYNRWLTYNPNDIASPAAPGDSFLIENFCYDNTGPSVIWDTQERASLIRPVATAKDIELWAVAVFGETTPGTLDLTKIGSFDNLDQCGEYISANAYLYDISIVGSGGFSFGSAGNPVWAPLYRLPANANVADYPASNNYTTKTCVRQFGPVNVAVVNDTTIQSVTVVGGDTNIVGDTAKMAEYAKVAVTPGGQPGYLWGTDGDNGVLRVEPGLRWDKAANGTHATLGINAVDGGDLKLQFKRLTRTELTAAEGSATVVNGEPYLVVDEDRIAIGTGDTTSVSFAKKSEVDAKLAANDPSVTNAREWTAATVTQAAAAAGTDTARSAWTAQRVRQAVAGWWTGAASKTTPVDADSVGIYDSAASGVLKRLTIANLKTWISGLFVSRTNAQIDGNLNINGTGRRITGDFSNATVTSRTCIQTNVANSPTFVHVLPSGSSATTALKLESDSAFASGAVGSLDVTSTEFRISANQRGASPYAPLTFYTGNAERIRVAANGYVGVGINDPTYSVDVLGDSAAVCLNARGRTSDNISVIRFATSNNTETYRIISFPDGRGLVLQSTSGDPVLVTGGALGYGVGAGGIVTQPTNKGTTVSLNKPSGRIIMSNAALAGNSVIQFIVNNSVVAATDTVVCNVTGGTGDVNAYTSNTFPYAGGFYVSLRNMTSGSLSDAVQLQFNVIKGATS